MEFLKEKEFKDRVLELLSKNGIKAERTIKAVRKESLLDEKLYFDFDRKSGKHTPDLWIDRVPCELKSSGELYSVCRYSKAHLYSYLLQIIYGQCLSYGDLFRKDDSQLITNLIIPDEIPVIGNLEDALNEVLESNDLYKKCMGLKDIKFESPLPCLKNSKFAVLKDGYFGVLWTKISYFI
ncbi:MAG: hypothetical protein WCR55_09855 [Lentisphaerota bacterium]